MDYVNMKISKSGKLYIFMLLAFIIIGIMTTVILINIQNVDTQKIYLTTEEKIWLFEHKDEIRIGYTTDYPPVEFLSNGKYVGISADYFSLLEQKLGIKIQMVQFDNWDELIRQAQSRQITGITAATKTSERNRYLDFTIPYVDNPNVIITRKNFSEELSFEKLANTSMKIIVVENYDIIEFLKERFPKLDYITVKSASEGMRMVAFGEADAMIVEIMSASATIERDNISNLMVNAETPYESNLSIATRNDWPMLSGIFNKGLSQISDHEKKVIEQKWMPIQRKSIFENIYFWIAFLGFVLILFAVIVFISAWNKSLKKAVRDKTMALEQSTEELRFKTYHDELTKLYNRVYMAEILPKLEQENTVPFSIIVADLNGLKITNDTFGHETGDRMLIKVSEIIKANIKDTHLACRIGGDEIVVLMPSTSEQDCIQILDNIKMDTLNAEEDPIKPLVALGCATADEENNDYSKIFKLAEDKMYANKMDNSEKNYDMIIDSIKKNLHENKYESIEHHERMIKMCVEMGKLLKLNKTDMKDIALLAGLHDVGKVGLEKELLNKKAPLTIDEWKKVKRHPELGFKIVSASTKLSHIGKSILAHHEHWNGKGYPQGLKGKEIPLIARIFSIVEAYDAMTHERTYKPTYTHDRAIKELKTCSTTQFDPYLVEIFIKYINNSKMLN